ncbi:MAG: penicillin-binding protein 2, partial [Verrucomicrobia bacterium]|nr:penicillin-binding protein 2 [Cytophagales bacterium]
MNIKNEILFRVRIAFVAVAFFAMAVVGRMFYIQWGMGEYWKKLAQQKTTKRLVIPATRGNIFATDGSLLATSIPQYKLAFDPSVFDVKKFSKEKTNQLFRDSVRILSGLLAKHFGDRTAKEYERMMLDARQNESEYLVLNAKNINYSEKKKMQQWPLFRLGRNKGGVIFERIDKRYLPFKYLARRTIGFINEDSLGAGLEYSFNKRLAGSDGESLFQRTANGNWKPIFDAEDIRPEPGKDIYTTIDLSLQDVAETSLFDALTEHDADYGCVVVMEVATGEIKTIANLGKFKNGYAETYNYALGNHGVTEPGSTFKLASLMALFEETGLELTDSINTGDGILKYQGVEMRDSKKGGHGRITVQQAFELSSNIAFVKLISKHFGNKSGRFIDYLKSFGLDKPLGFQMAGTGISKIKTPRDATWSGISLPWMSIGYETQMSPLQMLTFYNAVANNGNMVQPVIVKEVRMAEEVVEKYPSGIIIREKICSPKTLAKVKKCLVGVVERGTATNIRNPYYKIAGKTGTSQKFKNGRYTQSYYTSFIGFFPAEKPKYSCIVVIDNPRGELQYGRDVAAPVFKDIADKIFARDPEMHKNLSQQVFATKILPDISTGKQEDLQFLCQQLSIRQRILQGSDWVSAATNQQTINWKKKTVGLYETPDVQGMTLRDALFVLEN